MNILAAYPTYIWLTLVLYLAIATLLSVVANRYFLQWLTHLGMHTPKGQQKEIIRWASQSKPTVGGISFYAVFVAAVIAGLSWVYRKGEPMEQLLLSFLPLFVSVTLGFILGLIDDLRHTSPATKFVGQLLCAVLLIMGNTYIPISNYFWVNALFTIVWVVGIMNSINMLDNMDGITATVSASIIAGIILLLVANGLLTSFYSILALGVLGGIWGFLYFNWHPARMYMGDSGSQFLGVFLSILSIKFLWSFRPSPDSNFALQQFILPAVAFLLPITDTTTVFVRRIARGQSPFQGGRDHTTHHLVYCGLTDKQVARVFLLLSLLSVAAVLFISQHFLHNTWTYTQSVVSIMACLTLFLVMQYFYNLGKKRQQTQAAITEKLANVLQKEHTAASANKQPINFKKSNLFANKKKTPE